LGFRRFIFHECHSSFGCLNGLAKGLVQRIWLAGGSVGLLFHAWARRALNHTEGTVAGEAGSGRIRTDFCLLY
jgi:hypothetical protein